MWTTWLHMAVRFPPSLTPARRLATLWLRHPDLQDPTMRIQPVEYKTKMKGWSFNVSSWGCTISLHPCITIFPNFQVPSLSDAILSLKYFSKIGWYLDVLGTVHSKMICSGSTMGAQCFMPRRCKEWRKVAADLNFNHKWSSGWWSRPFLPISSLV